MNFTRSVATRSLLLAVLAGASLGAHAHHPWLLPSSTLVEGKDGVVAIDGATSEDLFEFDARGLPLDGLTVTGPDGGAVVPSALNTGSRHRTSFELALEQPGTYRVANVSEGVMASYRQGGETKRFRGTREAWAKAQPADAADVRVTGTASRVETFVARQRPSDQPFAATNAGLELIPLDPPVDLSDGDRTRFRLLLDGKPLPETTVSLLRGGNRYRYKMGEQSLRTDAKGEFAVAWGEPGRYWLGVSHTVPGATAEAPPARRLSYSATLEVRPR
jgi:uncharacterized GH25 family protein